MVLVIDAGLDGALRGAIGIRNRVGDDLGIDDGTNNHGEVIAQGLGQGRIFQ